MRKKYFRRLNLPYNKEIIYDAVDMWFFEMEGGEIEWFQNGRWARCFDKNYTLSKPLYEKIKENLVIEKEKREKEWKEKRDLFKF